MSKLFSLRRDERGAAAIEMAIAVPVLTLFLWGIFQIGIAFQANAGMQHALGEGARLATLCINPTPANGCDAPTNDQISTRISQKVFGTHVGSFSTPSVTDGPTGTNYKDLSVTFTMPMDFLFFQGPSINLTRTKRVYVAH
ncbi:MAG TPA: TadE/TadG family type IV pilus assembly protein [Reyranellaceae bacterium]|nr:TadE/TadG family type IV pilus assembly protein [Reyranellaceae bacterium]